MAAAHVALWVPVGFLDVESREYTRIFLISRRGGVVEATVRDARVVGRGRVGLVVGQPVLAVDV